MRHQNIYVLLMQIRPLVTGTGFLVDVTTINETVIVVAEFKTKQPFRGRIFRSTVIAQMRERERAMVFPLGVSAKPYR